jgi:hypothetical protein
MHPEICTSDSVTSDSMPTCHALGKKQVSGRIESCLARTYSLVTYLILFIFWCAATNTQSAMISGFLKMDGRKW